VKGEGIEASVAAVVRAAPGRVAVHAFDHRIPAAVGALVPGLARGILQSSYLVDSRHALAAAGAADLWQHWPLIDGHLVLAAHAAGARVVAWTVNAPADAIRLASLGVGAICTDHCDAIRDALLEAGFTAT
jgi:glycerophosphoryl diester phosphodiesterase